MALNRKRNRTEPNTPCWWGQASLEKKIMENRDWVKGNGVKCLLSHWPEHTGNDHRAGLRMGYLQFFPWKLFSSQPALPVLTLYEQLSLLFLHSSIPPSPSRLHKAVVHACQSQTQARQAPLSTTFPRQEYWTGFPFPSPDPGIESASAICRGFDRKRALQVKITHCLGRHPTEFEVTWARTFIDSRKVGLDRRVLMVPNVT